jgi:hypothetical protein
MGATCRRRPGTTADSVRVAGTPSLMRARGAKSVQHRRVCTHLTLESSVIADLDTLLTALYVELTDRIIPSLGLGRSGGRRSSAPTRR